MNTDKRGRRRFAPRPDGGGTFAGPARPSRHGRSRFTSRFPRWRGRDRWVEFCASNPGECATVASTPRDVVLTPRAFKDLASVNRYVNKPSADDRLEHWGTIENGPTRRRLRRLRDYVLQKRRLLLQAGWPREALLITSCATARTRARGAHGQDDRGEYILDNQAEDILPWFETATLRQTPIAEGPQRVGVARRSPPRRHRAASTARTEFGARDGHVPPPVQTGTRAALPQAPALF